MPVATASVAVADKLSHPASVAALGPDAREFFAAHGYPLARLARRNRVSRQMMQLFFAGGTVSGRLVRNLTKLRAQLQARDDAADAVIVAHLEGLTHAETD